MEKYLFVLVFFLAYTIQGVTGFAGNPLAMPAGTALLGLGSSIAVLNAMGVFACGGLAICNIKSVNWRELGKIVSVMIVFMFVGIWLDTVLPMDMLLNIFGVVIILVGLKNLLIKKQKDLPEWALWGILVLAGLVQGMFVSGGALLVIYAVQKFKDRQEFRITLSAVWAVLNFVYAIISAHNGYFTTDVLLVVLMCIPTAVFATYLGNRLQKRVSQEAFLKLTYVLLLTMGVILVIT